MIEINRNLFYLNEKINGMVANEGYYKLGKNISEIVNINNKYKIFTTLDWGRESGPTTRTGFGEWGLNI